MEDSYSSGLSRREILGGLASLATLPNLAFSKTQPTATFVVGCWARRPNRLPLTVLTGPSATDQWTFGAPHDVITNTFFGYVHPKSKKIYLALNSDRTIVRARVSSDGKLVEEARWPSGGGEPSFIDGDKTGQYLAVANFDASVESTIAVFRVGEKLELIATKTTTGQGPLDRQDRPHFHGTRFSPDNKFIYGCDLGGDQVLAFPFDAATGKVGEQILAYKAAPGAGPRHILFHASGRYAYVNNSLNSTLPTLRVNPDGTLTLVEMQSTLPDPSYKGYNHPGHIEIDASGRYLYVSNRGHDTLGVFAISPEGRLKNLQWISSGGEWPWHFVLASPTEMLVANWQSNNIARFDIKKDGTLAPQGKPLPIKGPIYILKAPA
jgi:6-phosphogluconolactonase